MSAVQRPPGRLLPVATMLAAVLLLWAVGCILLNAPGAIERVLLPRPLAQWQDRLALLGCGVVGFVLLFVFVIGIGTIAGWVR